MWEISGEEGARTSALLGLLFHSSFPTHWGFLAGIDPLLSSQIQLALATPLVSGWF